MVFKKKNDAKAGFKKRREFKFGHIKRNAIAYKLYHVYLD